MQYYVEIVEFSTDQVHSQMGPMSERRAERVERGAEINLDHRNFFVRIVEDGEQVHENEVLGR